MIVEEKCRDFGRPGCLGDPDDRFVVSFEDIGEGVIKFCASCGPSALAMDAAITRLASTPEGLAKLTAALDAVKCVHRS